MKKLIRIALLLQASVALAAGNVERMSQVCPDTGRDVTALLQAEMVAISKDGGGRLRLGSGRYLVSDLSLPDNVELRLDRNAVLAGAPGGVYPSYETYPLNSPEKRGHAVLRADDVTNVAVTGEGTIDGNGAVSVRTKPKRKLDGPESDSVALYDGRYALLFTRCRNVRIEGVTVRGASFWTCFLRDCDGVVVRSATVFAHANYNNDGIDISSRNVLVEDCTVDAEDDAIVFKSFQPDIAVSNVVVRNCRLSTNSSFIKVGTETFGEFRDILVENCTCACLTPSVTIPPHDFPGEIRGARNHSISGFEINIVDGGRLDGMTVRNIDFGRGVGTPFSVRLGRRHKSRLPGGSCLRHVRIEGIRMSEPAANAVACSITGVPGLKPEDVVIRNSDFQFPGAAPESLGAVNPTDECERSFPWPFVFKAALPAYGLYVRNADGVVLENVQFRLPDEVDDFRQPVYFER